MKYKINKEFFPYSKLKPPINMPMISLAQKVMRPPRFFFKDPILKIDTIHFQSFDNAVLQSFVISPLSIKDNSPYIIFLHGGGFIFEAANYHYKLAMEYSKQTNSKVFFIQYRLSPKIKLPDIVMDVYYGFKYIYSNSSSFNIDKTNVGIVGDSAGAYLAANLVNLLKNEDININCQMLIYPFLDNSLTSESTKKYTDTPMWNSKLSKKILKYILPSDIEYKSPIYDKDFTDFPPTYIEIAEFDSLRDDGTLYYNLLKEYNVETEFHEIHGAMHGFDIKYNSETSQQAIKNRVSFLNKHIK